MVQTGYISSQEGRLDSEHLSLSRWDTDVSRLCNTIDTVEVKSKNMKFAE